MNALFLALTVPAAVIAYVYLALLVLSHMRQRRRGESSQAFTVGIRTSFVRVLIGLVLVFAGALLFQEAGLLTALGVYALILGYQIVLWAVGIESEYLGTIPTNKSSL